MLGTRAFQHRLFPVGALSKCAYLFVVLGIVYPFCNTSDADNQQATTHSLHGEVFDKQNQARLEGIVVSIIELKRSTQTDANGQFEFDAVPEGQYTLRFTSLNRLLMSTPPRLIPAAGSKLLIFSVFLSEVLSTRRYPFQ